VFVCLSFFGVCVWVWVLLCGWGGCGVVCLGGVGCVGWGGVCWVGIGRTICSQSGDHGFGKPAGVVRLTTIPWFDVLGAAVPRNALVGARGQDRRKLARSGIETSVTWPSRARGGWPGVRPGEPSGLVRLARGQDHSPVTAPP